MTLPTNIKKWLNDRGISDGVIGNHNISWNGSQIVIPVYNKDATFAFNKYRKNPFSDEEGPKYKYDSGSTATLYNIRNFSWIDRRLPIVICEGELDCLALESIGGFAFSSTGGSGTFKDEWVNLLQWATNIYVCYDNDEAGHKGAIKVLSKIPNAKWIVLPESVGKHGDITDFLKSGGDFVELMKSAESYSIFKLREPDKLKTIKECKEWIKKYNEQADILWQLIRRDKKEHLTYITKAIENRIIQLKRRIKTIRYEKNKDSIFNHPVDNPNTITEEHIRRAKEVPIETLYHGQLHYSGNRATGRCPFHNERTASFTIYLDQNTFHCYGCGAGRDAIDYIMKEKEIDFPQAVKILLH